VDGRAPRSLQEAVPGGHVELPGLEFREAVNGDSTEEVLCGDEDEIVGVHEKRFPDLVSVVPELPETRRGDCPKGFVLGDDDVDEADLIDAWIADFAKLGREKLLAQELVEGLVEKVLDSRRNLQVDRRERTIEKFSVGLDTIGTVSAEALVNGWVALGIFPLEHEECVVSFRALVEHNAIQ